MSSLHESSLADFTRGGQTTLHFLRMLGQVIRKFMGAIALLYLAMTIATFLVKTTEYERYLGFRYAVTYLSVELWDTGPNPVDIRMPNGAMQRTTMHALYVSPVMRDNANRLMTAWLMSMAISMAIAGFILTIVFTWIWRYGAKQKAEKHLRGSAIVEVDVLRKYLQQSKKASKLIVAGVPIVEHSETAHILATGSPGTGKSTTLNELMNQIRKRGDRCICFSPSGDFIQWFYEGGRDSLLNPFDARSPSWDLWEECSESYHYDMLSAAIIPEPVKGDPFWNTAARTLLSCLLERMSDWEDRSIDKLLNFLNVVALEDLHQLLRGTEAAPLMDPASEKTATSIRTTATTYARALKFLPEGKEAFHIREWVGQDKGNGWIFLNARPDQINSVRPLLSAWLEVFTNSLMSLPPNRDRRIWLIIDELPSLNKIPSLTDFLAQARKYGGCGVIAFQQITQLKEKYGNDGAASLAGLCATWVCMRQNDPETAKWSADSFGQAEIMEMNENVSYGAHEIRDGVSLSQNRQMRNIVLSSQISNLDDLEGYIRLSGDVPIGHFRMQRKSIKDKSEAFIARPVQQAQVVESPKAKADPVGESPDSESAKTPGAILAEDSLATAMDLD